MIFRFALPLLFCALGSAVAQVNTDDTLQKRDAATVQAPPARRAPDPQLGEKLGRIDADLRDAKTPAERARLQAERARLLQESTGEEMTIQTGATSTSAPPATSSASQTRGSDYGAMENAPPEPEVIEVDPPRPASSGASSARHTALPSRTARVRTPPAAPRPASAAQSARRTTALRPPTSRPPATASAATQRRPSSAPLVRAVPARSAPRTVERQEVRESGGVVDRASAMARRGQRTEARRTLIDYLRRNPRSPQAIEVRKLLQTL